MKLHFFFFFGFSFLRLQQLLLFLDYKFRFYSFLTELRLLLLFSAFYNYSSRSNKVIFSNLAKKKSYKFFSGVFSSFFFFVFTHYKIRSVIFFFFWICISFLVAVFKPFKYIQIRCHQSSTKTVFCATKRVEKNERLV